MLDKLRILHLKTFGVEPSEVKALRAHASRRSLYRLSSKDKSVIGVLNPNFSENKAFVALSLHFKKFNLPFPEIYASLADDSGYLEEDLGDLTLYDFLEKTRTRADPFPAEVEAAYAQVLQLLPKIQIEAGQKVDFRMCTPRSDFDRESMLWDMHFFRDSFLKRSGIEFNAEKLERDFEALAGFLLGAESKYFLYRDFQARNIMLRSGKPFFIDFQSGRRGPLQYDVASLLFQSKAEIPPAARARLLEVYLSEAQKLIPLSSAQFKETFYGFVLIRLLQVLGTYGEQGLTQGKDYFKQSIPLAINNLSELLYMPRGLPNLPELGRICEALVNQINPDNTGLDVQILSFSYRHGLPVDNSGHGGGFVFDCRSIKNPGREPDYKMLTGKDETVIQYIESQSGVPEFQAHAFSLIDQTIKSHLARSFRRLSIAFGCTGGQHRSVYFAEKLAQHLKANTSVRVSVQHLELGGLKL